MHHTALSDDGVHETCGCDVESRIERLNATGSCLSDMMLNADATKKWMRNFAWTPIGDVTSELCRCSMTIPLPEAMVKSKELKGAATKKGTL